MVLILSLAFIIKPLLASSEKQINLVYVEDSKVIRQATKNLVQSYGEKFKYKTFEDGDELTLDSLVGVHLVLCDINMARLNGDEALGNLKQKALVDDFILPPFVAVTDDARYHNVDGKVSDLAKEKHFIGGWNKVKRGEIEIILDYCKDLYGENWLTAHVGGYFTADNPNIIQETNAIEGPITVQIQLPEASDPVQTSKVSHQVQNETSWLSICSNICIRMAESVPCYPGEWAAETRIHPEIPVC